MKWLDGKKTAIGLICQGVALLCLNCEWLTPETYLLWANIAQGITGVGVAHKVAKKVKGK